MGKIPILTNIFQMGWNHQPVLEFYPLAVKLWAPMILINGVITTINGLISGFPLGF